MVFEHLQRPRRRDRVHHRVRGSEHPQPPAAASVIGGLAEYPPRRLVHVRVPGGGVSRGDRGRQRRKQLLQPPGHPGQRARRHLQALHRQHRDHPVERQPERVLGDKQVHAELRREQAPGNQRRRAGRGPHRRHRALAAPGVLAPPVHHPPHPDPPRYLLAGILPEQLIGPAAPRAAPLALRNVMDLLLGLQVLMPAPPMPGRSRPLTPAPPARSAAIPCRGVIPAAGVGGLPARLPLTGAVFLAGGAEQHPAQRHHPLLQRGQLLLLRGHRRGQRGVLRLQPHVLPGQPRVLCLQQLRPLTPERRLISGPGTSTRSHHAKAAPPPVPVSSTAAPAPPACRLRRPATLSPPESPNTYIRPVIRDGQRRASYRCLAFLPPLGCRHSLLGHPVPPGNWAPLAVGLPAHPEVHRTLTGFPCSARMSNGWGWVSSVPRRRRCPHGQAMSLTAACRIATACPCLPGITTRPGESQLRGISKASLLFTPCPAFPSPVIPRRSGNPWAFP